MRSILLVALWLFVITHVDTFVVLVAFCRHEAYTRREILIGHYAGFTLGLITAVFVAFVAAGVLQRWVFLLGTVPLGLGLLGLLGQRSSASASIVDGPGSMSHIGVVTGTGVGLSGENIAVYVPFFLRLSPSELAVVLGAFTVAAGVTFLAALVTVRHTADVPVPEWLDRWLVPSTLVVVGVYILLTGWVIA